MFITTVCLIFLIKLRWPKTKNSLLTFGSCWESLKVLILEFEWFPSEVHCELETKTVSNFWHFLSLPSVMSQGIITMILVVLEITCQKIVAMLCRTRRD